MTVLVIALLLAAAAAVTWWYFGQKEPPAAEEDEATTRLRCRRQAQMRNFWAYDGTEQTDVEELAEALYRKREEK